MCHPAPPPFTLGATGLGADSVSVWWPALGGVHTSSYTNMEADQVLHVKERAADDNVESFCPDANDGAAPSQRFLAAVRTGEEQCAASCLLSGHLPSLTLILYCMSTQQALLGTPTLWVTTCAAEWPHLAPQPAVCLAVACALASPTTSSRP